MSKYYYRVVDILDNKSIIINYGKDHGAVVDRKIRIVSIGPEIIDPETNKTLGTLNSIKDVLTIVTIYDKFSICQKIETTTKSVLANPLSQFSTVTKTIETLHVDENDITNKEIPNDRVIRVGDKAEII